MAPRSPYSALVNWDGSISRPQSRQQSVSSPTTHIQGRHSAIHRDRREEHADWSSISPSPRVQHGFAMSRSKDASIEPADPATDPLLLAYGSALEREVEHTRSSRPISSYTYSHVSEFQKPGHANQASIASLMAASQALRDRTGTSSFGTSLGEPSSSILDREIIDLTLSECEDTQSVKSDHGRDESKTENSQHKAHSEQRRQSVPRIAIMDQPLQRHREAITPRRSAYKSAGRSDNSIVPDLAQWRNAPEPRLDTSPLPGTPVSGMSRSMSTLNEAVSIQAVPLPYVSSLDRELSVVPATPESTSSQLSTFSIVGSTSTFPRHDARERSPSVPSVLRDSSTGGSTLIGSLAVNAQSVKWPAAEELFLGSPLTSVSSLSEPLQHQALTRRNKQLLGQPRRAKVLEVFVPSLSRERKEQYKSFDACRSQIQARISEKQSSLPSPSPSPSKQLSARPTRKRKRDIPSSVAASASTSVPIGPPRKKVARNERRQTTANPSAISATKLSLDASLGGAAWDPLAQYCEYVPIDVNTRCEEDMIYDRIQDPKVLWRVVWCATRHWREPVPHRTEREATEQTSCVKTSRAPTPRSHTPTLQPLSKTHGSLDALQGYGSSSSPSPSPHAKLAASTTTLPAPSSRAASVSTPGRMHPTYPPLTGTSISPHRTIGLQPGQALAFAQAHQQLPQTQDAFSAVRGHDAFLGGGHEDDELFIGMASQTPNQRDTFGDTSLGSMSDPPWPVDEDQTHLTYGMEELFPSHDAGEVHELGLSGFIDPILLGGTAVTTAPSRASPSPPPFEAVMSNTSPQHQQARASSSSDFESFKRGSSPQDIGRSKFEGKAKEPENSERKQTEDTPEPGGDKGNKQKQKQPSLYRQVKPHEYFGLTPDVNVVAGELSEQHIVFGKRDRKLSKRGQDSVIASKEVAKILVEDLPKASDATSRSLSVRRSQSRVTVSAPENKVKPSGDGKHHRPPPPRKPKTTSAPAEESAYCHQCRNKRVTAKMQCTNNRDDGSPCDLRFCARCIYLRYKNIITFDADAMEFICPKCQGICNCTSCCSRRGETYVSSKGVKVDWSQVPGMGVSSTSNSSTRKNKPGAKKKKRHSSEDFEDVPIDPSMMLPSGATWGTVYGRDGERMGVAVVVDNERQEIALQAHGLSTVPRKKRSSHKFIGIPRKHWRVADEPATPSPAADTVPTESGKAKVVHAYAGSKEPLYTWNHEQAFEGGLTPLPSPSGSDSPEEIPPEELSFLLARIVASDGQNVDS